MRTPTKLNSSRGSYDMLRNVVLILTARVRGPGRPRRRSKLPTADSVLHPRAGVACAISG